MQMGSQWDACLWLGYALQPDSERWIELWAAEHFCGFILVRNDTDSSLRSRRCFLLLLMAGPILPNQTVSRYPGPGESGILLSRTLQDLLMNFEWTCTGC